MILAAALFLGALAVAWFAPAILVRLNGSRVDPVAVIVCWVVSIAAVLATFAAGAVLVVLPGHGPARGVLELVHSCWATLRHGGLPQLDEIAGSIGLLVLAVAVIRCVISSARHLAARRRTHERHLAMLNILGRREDDPLPIMWLEHTEPLVYSVGGKPGLIVATSAVAELPDEQLAAVLAHERAHVQGQHHLLISLTDSLAKALPFLPLLRRAPAALRLLVELAADSAAARAFGPRTVGAALRALARGGGHAPEHALALARDAVELRLRRLENNAPRGRPRRIVASGAAGLAAATLPIMIGFGTLLFAALLSC